MFGRVSQPSVDAMPKSRNFASVRERWNFPNKNPKKEIVDGTESRIELVRGSGWWGGVGSQQSLVSDIVGNLVGLPPIVVDVVVDRPIFEEAQPQF